MATIGLKISLRPLRKYKNKQMTFKQHGHFSISPRKKTDDGLASSIPGAVEAYFVSTTRIPVSTPHNSDSTADHA